jgi:four helix bundle protein
MPDHVSDEQRAWERTCSPAITSDVIWKLDAYRAALFLLHVARVDCRALRAARPEDRTAPQLKDAATSVSAHVGEGYSRATRADRLRFLGYALGSVRECLSWYEAARDVIPDDVVEERLALVARLRSLLLGMIKSLRRDGNGRHGFER